jgi:hypothetical protein
MLNELDIVYWSWTLESYRVAQKCGEAHSDKRIYWNYSLGELWEILCDSTAYIFFFQITMQGTKENYYKRKYRNLDDILKITNDCRQENHLKSTDG